MSLAGGPSLAMLQQNFRQKPESCLMPVFTEFVLVPMTRSAPGDQLTETQIRRKLETLKPHVGWVRTFSCTEGNEIIARVATELGIKTLVGAVWR